ncbi:MAG: amidohydrolase [Pyrinomonadaceae bacterium]|nr:amidohydrolase [Pyrinomonadaceae bacterium]
MMDQIYYIRQKLHQNPELSGNEVETSRFVAEKLKEFGITEIHTDFAQQSVLVVIRGKQPGKTILFRSELDALPITETNTFEHRSVQDGISHKCGHDGHIATLIALAQHFAENQPEKGIILFLFQSAEEVGTGAKAILDSNILEKFNVDFTFAYHNLPGYPLGQILCKSGTFTPSVESFNATLIGKTCHASEPHKGVNPANAIAEFVQFMERFGQPNKQTQDYCIVTPIHISLGEKNYGIAAGRAEIGYTVRTWTAQNLTELKNKVAQKIEEICSKQGLEWYLEWFESFHSNHNDANAVEIIESACKKLGYSYQNLEQPLDFGEDFGLFTEHFSGAMFGLGSGEDCPALHTVDYDFPNQLLPIASNILKEIARQCLE